MFQPILPTVFEVEDGELILKEVLKSVKSSVPIHTFCGTVVITEHFLQSLIKPYNDEIIQKKANEVSSCRNLEIVICR